MSVNNIGFWNYCEVIDFSNQLNSPIKKFLKSSGERVDNFFSFGSKCQVIHVNNAIDHVKLANLKGKAKVFLSSHSLDVNFYGGWRDNRKLTLKTLITKIILISLFFFPLILIKGTYRFVYLNHLKKNCNSDNQLNILIQQNPSDIDLQLLKKHLEFEKTALYSLDSKNFNKTKELTLYLKEILRKNPRHCHANKFLEEIYQTFIKQSIANNFKEVFEFFFKNFKHKIPSFWQDQYAKLKSEQELNYFYFLWESTVLKRNDINEKNVLFELMLTFDSINSIEDFINTVNWLINKDRVQYAKPEFKKKQEFYRLGHTVSQIANSIKNQIDLKNCKALDATKLVELFRRIEELDSGFTQEVKERQILSNLFGLDLETKTNQQIFSLKGLKNSDYQHFTSVDSTFDYFSQNKKMFDLNKVLEKLQNSNSVLAPKMSKLIKIITHPNKHNFYFSTISMTGFRHAISQVFYKDMFFLGNRGGGCGSHPGILVFKTTYDENFDPTDMKFVELDKLPKGYSNYINKLLDQDFFKKINAKLIGYIPLSYQKHHNCPWKAFKMNILSILFMQDIVECDQQAASFDVLKNTFFPDCLKLQKIITHECRLEAFRNYLERHKRNPSIFDKDENLIQKIQTKAKRKNWVLT